MDRIIYETDRPPSYCPCCGHAVTLYADDLSYMYGRGDMRCPACTTAWRYERDEPAYRAAFVIEEA